MKKLAMEVKSVRSMLDESVAAWKRYSACVDLLTVWISEGEQVMRRSPEEKEVRSGGKGLNSVSLSLICLLRGRGERDLTLSH